MSRIVRALLRRYPSGTQTIENQAAAAIPLVVRGHASQSANLFVVENSGGTDLVYVDSTGKLGVGIASSGDANAVIDLAKGINFPDTAVASSDVNTLDDYEEGTWTPAISCNTPGDLSVSYSTQYGKYTKVGRKVYIEAHVVTSAFTHTTASGTVFVSGLPFPCAGTPDGSVGVIWSGWTKAGYQVNSGLVFSSVFPRVYGSGNLVGPLTMADLPTGTVQTVYISGSYHA